MAWCTLTTSTVRNNSGNVLGDDFFGTGEFNFLGGRHLCVLDGCLVCEVLEDGDGAVFKVIDIGKDSCVPRGWLLDAALHGDRVLDFLCTVEDASGHPSKQEQMCEICVYCGYDVFVHR